MPTAAALATIRAGLQARLDTIPSLAGRTFPYVPDNVNPPCAFVALPERILYDETYGRGADSYTLLIRLYVNRIVDFDSQVKLDAYLAASGPESVKTAIEGDRTLGGAVQSLHVVEARNYGPYQASTDVQYLGVEFVVDLFG